MNESMSQSIAVKVGAHRLWRSVNNGRLHASEIS